MADNSIDKAAKSIESKEDSVRNALKNNKEVDAVLAFEKLSKEVHSVQPGDNAALIFAKVVGDDAAKGKESFVSMGSYGGLDLKRPIEDKMSDMERKNEDAILTAHLNEHFKMFGRPEDPHTPGEAAKADAALINQTPPAIAHFQERLFNIKDAGDSSMAWQYLGMVNKELEKLGANVELNFDHCGRSKDKKNNSWGEFSVVNKTTGDSEKYPLILPK